MGMPGRKFTQGNSSYRYGFNGKEDDKDISEGGQDYGMRIYDARIARFLSTDPITAKYPMLTPYQFASNSPISGVDIDGLEFFYSADGKFIGKFGKSTEIRIIKNDNLNYAAGLLAIHKKDPAGVGKEALKRFAHPNTAMKFALNDASVPAFKNTQENQETVLKEWAGQNRTTEREKVMSLFVLKIDNPDGKGQSEVFIQGSTGEGEKYTRGSGGAMVDPASSTTKFSNAIRSTTIHTHPFGGPLDFSNEVSGAFRGGDLQWALLNGVNMYLVPPHGNEMGMFDVNMYKKIVRAGLEAQYGDYYKKMTDAELFGGERPIGDPYYSKPEAKLSMQKVEIKTPK